MTCKTIWTGVEFAVLFSSPLVGLNPHFVMALLGRLCLSLNRLRQLWNELKKKYL